MKQIFIFSLFFFLTNCKKSEKGELVKVQFIEFKKCDTLTERNYIAIFDKDTEKKSSLSKAELKIVNENLIKSVNKYNEDKKLELEKWNKENPKDHLNYNEEKIDLRFYYRNYIVSTNKNGEKIVRVKCFCEYQSHWRNSIVSVHDGGKCFLNAVINLTKNEVEYFGTNGLA